MVKTVIIVGFGGHARGSWLKSIKMHPDYKLVGIVDTDTELLQNVPSMGTDLAEDQAYRKIEEVVEHNPKPDLAVIATPIPTHHIMVKEAMDLGINVICEKNLASTIYQGRQMLQLALDHPELSTGTGFQRRYSTQNWTAKKYLQGPDNEIGQLSFIDWADAFSWGLYREGWRQWLQDLYAEDQMIHWFDLMRFISGMDIVQVKADSFIQNWSDWQGAPTVLANLALAKPEDYEHRHKWTWARFYGDWQHKGPQLDTWEFYGDKGRFKITGPWGLEVLKYTDAAGLKWEEDGYMPQQDVENMGTDYDGQRIILEQMSRSIDSGGQNQPQTNFRDTFKSFAATVAAIESSRTGQSIFVPDYWKGMLP